MTSAADDVIKHAVGGGQAAHRGPWRLMWKAGAEDDLWPEHIHIKTLHMSCPLVATDGNDAN